MQNNVYSKEICEEIVQLKQRGVPNYLIDYYYKYHQNYVKKLNSRYNKWRLKNEY